MQIDEPQAGFGKLTDNSLPIFRSQTDNLHFDVGSTDRGQHSLYFGPDAEYRAAQDEVGPAPQPDLTL